MKRWTCVTKFKLCPQGTSDTPTTEKTFVNQPKKYCSSGGGGDGGGGVGGGNGSSDQDHVTARICSRTPSLAEVAPKVYSTCGPGCDLLTERKCGCSSSSKWGIN